MKKLILFFFGAIALTASMFAGSETYSSKETKQTAATQPFCDWYANQEWNASLWGTYAFTGNEARDDRFLAVDHAWGGGADFKYFFARYFGVGVEGYALAARDTVGAALGTFTFRYPIPCTRFAPYVFAGGGAIFNGSRIEEATDANGDLFRSIKDDSKARAVGQFGGGLEFRITPHIGLINDFSWDVVDGPNNNFGMVRSGINFAF